MAKDFSISGSGRLSRMEKILQSLILVITFKKVIFSFFFLVFVLFCFCLLLFKKITSEMPEACVQAL